MSDESGKVIHLVRHGEATSKEENAQRPLTEAGRAAVGRIAGWAAEAGVRADQIRHSGKLRAEQTAQIFAEHLAGAPGPVATSGLGPNDDVVPVADRIGDEDHSVMIVGHMPFLGKLASQLLIDDPERSLIEFGAGAVVTLAQDYNGWRLRCVMQPEMVP